MTDPVDLGDIGALDKGSMMHPFTSIAGHLAGEPRVMLRGEGAYLYDSAGRRYLDGAAGLWCVNAGHVQQPIVEAICRQAGTLEFSHCFTSFANEPSARLAAEVLSLAGDRFARVFFGLTGSDANETNVKIAWYYNHARGRPEKRKLIAQRRGYHGVTVLAGSLTGLDNVHRGFNLPLDIVRHVDTPDLYRRPEIARGLSEEDYATLLADRLDALIREEGPETVAAFIAEPVMGVAGVLPPPKSYFEKVAAVLRRHEVLFIADEVITGFGRLGTWFGMDRFGFTPDLVTVAKGMTSGYLPMSAALIGREVWDVIAGSTMAQESFGHGFTYSGHPLSAAAGLANLEFIKSRGLVERVASLEPTLSDMLQHYLPDLPMVGDVRCIGLLAAVELVADRDARLAFPAAQKKAFDVVAECARRGVIVRGLYPGDVVAFSPPFVVAESELETIVRTLGEAIRTVWLNSN